MRKKLFNSLARPGVRLNRWKAMSIRSRIALLFLILIVFSAIFAPLLATHNPEFIDIKAQAPSAEYIFGTDNLGRDVYSRILYGGRYSMAVGLCATALALFFGAVIGSIAAVVRKSFSEAIMRVMDIIMAVPGIALAAVAVLVFRNPEAPESLIFVIICSIAFVYVPQLTRIVRANVISAYGEDYVNAVIVSGARAPWILVKHVIRNTAAPVLVFATVLVADAIILEASLTFIGAGLQEPTPTWGNILSAAQQGVLRGEWWQALFPGIAIMLTVLCLNILSEGITDAMVAAPSGQLKDAPRSDSEREADRLLIDPVAAHEAQRELLSARLQQLRSVEGTRTDRTHQTFDGEPLLEVKDLCIKFPRHGDVNVVDHVSFAVRPGQTMGLVGESGCGKSITSLAIMGLLDPKAEISGQILYRGQDLLTMKPKERQALLGHELAMIYQDALSSLNPSMLIRSQMKQLTSRGGTRTAEELLELVGLDPKRTLESYPHELSGGQRQRVLIAMALTRDPSLVIADEPTTALDVTVQKQVIDLLNTLRHKLGFAMVFVSHDLALEAEVADAITVMYAGQVVEQASTAELLIHPVHEYTRGLLGSVLSIEAASGRLHQVPGTVPSPKDFPTGDRFVPRSSHPTVGLHQTPVRLHIPQTDHYYASAVDDDGNVLMPVAEVLSNREGQEKDQ
ncbi:dipeptide/oligopeptide/nickel ABC transporter permease/ATP-binding protein [Schaalia sp. lx-100]|uniref:dipeptide/oligopeptide/nickel ABC transporter permease/ATP-binding protein n=1 Tax=Schaalia sp. lx-100 TaxID=2899081 RepID=UPI001E337558|nr:dipeptide/oligopeptide/nickel ABC transporter permease/ATP-binding protein [Schaalia sp. lx-100]MCD4557067.1 dipeptide/oligopeptide/nickel ABC transporter permease/ATP-binding protein [Schaalia sp. lx-100]